MKKTIMFTLLLTIICSPVALGQYDPFTATPELTKADDGRLLFSVSFTIPEEHFLYNDQLFVETGEGMEGVELVPEDIPTPKKKVDPFSAVENEIKEIYDHDFKLVYEVKGLAEETALAVEVSYQGCDEGTCFFPQTKKYTLQPSAGGGAAETPPVKTPDPVETPELDFQPSPPAAWEELVADFKITGTAAGYLKTDKFLAFLDRAEGAEGVKPTMADKLKESSTGLMIIIILFGGILLNLTPCVLPMIPINLAIIGAGAQAGSRGRGFALGGMYGLGIALTYGALGLLVVLGGATFGAINASPWFNFGIAILFVALGLAMAGVFNIDFTRFRGGGTGSPKSGFIAVFVMGCVAAFLAGACVAPVLIAVLLLSSNLYADGNNSGLLLPFLLGFGMALPWPFAGAGLSFLPKPNKWMVWIKNGFAALIMVMAVYYSWVGVSILNNRASSAESAELVALQESQAAKDGWLTSLPAALALAKKENKPVFIDFWATWCKNCLAMEKTTFKEDAIKDRFENYILLKYQAEDPNDPETKAVLDYFDSMGLPTYAVLKQ